MTVDRSALEVPTLIEALQTLVEALPEWSMAVDAGWSNRGFAAQPCWEDGFPVLLAFSP